MATFTIVGFWTDTLQRACLHVAAPSADEAEARCAGDHNGLAICGVFIGEHVTDESAEVIHFNDATA